MYLTKLYTFYVNVFPRKLFEVLKKNQLIEILTSNKLSALYQIHIYVLYVRTLLNDRRHFAAIIYTMFRKIKQLLCTMQTVEHVYMQAAWKAF